MRNEPEIELTHPITSRLAIGKGQYQLIEGEIFCSGGRVKKLAINQARHRRCRVELFSTQDSRRVRFQVSIGWQSADIGQRHKLELQILTSKGHETVHFLGEVELIAAAPTVAPLDCQGFGERPLVAICMASFNPDPGRLARQIESIICQQYDNWLLIISDDHSTAVDWHEIEALCALEPHRIRLIRHHQRLGFYHNFERALGYVPDVARFVALADQDDDWYPEKLRVLAARLQAQPKASLVYSDMRIVANSGELLSDTYWVRRRPEYDDFPALFVANTVTGAACLFRRELLDDLLPFPARLGNPFHDHWIACVAFLSGQIAYLCEPLYDYIQYDDSVIGHRDDDVQSLAGRIVRKMTGTERATKDNTQRWQTIYEQEFKRLQLMADTLKLRFPDAANDPYLNLMEGNYIASWRLIRRYLGDQFKHKATAGAELSLVLGWLLGRGQSQNCPVSRQRQAG